jgi:hypothetical protein
MPKFDSARKIVVQGDEEEELKSTSKISSISSSKHDSHGHKSFLKSQQPVTGYLVANEESNASISWG